MHAKVSKYFKKVLILLIILVFSVLSFSLGKTFAFVDLQYGLFRHPATMPVTVPNPMPAPAMPITDAYPTLLNALIQVESSGKPRAVNRTSGARGLTQITPVAWRELKKHYRHKYGKLSFREDMLRPEIAREAGKDFLCILQQHLKTLGIPPTLENLLAAYVWGEGKLARHGLQGAPRIVKRYVRDVKRIARIN